MILVVLVLLGAIAVGALRGGSVRRLAMLRLPHTGLVIAAGLLSVLGQYGGRLGLPGQAAYVVFTLLSVSLACVFVAANRHVVGVPLVAIGFFLNALVISLNGAMPVSQRAADFAVVSTDAAAAGTDARHEILTSHTRLRPLADVIPLHFREPLDWASNVYSAGDIVLAAGIGLLVMAGMQRPGAGRLARQVARGRLETIDLTRHDVPPSGPVADGAADGAAGVAMDADRPADSADLRLPSSFPAPW